MLRAVPLIRDRRGLAAVEFGLIAPVFFILMLGGMDLAHAYYVQSQLQGILQKAGRDASLETGTESARQVAIDTKVTQGVNNLIKSATVTLTRRFYRDFEKAAAATAEPYTDTNSNGRCDNGEPYQDNNNNSVWDADGGDAGQGGAKDTVVYQADVTFPRMFPMAKLLGFPNNVTMSAKTVLVNQPYGDQNSYGTATARNCPV